MKQKQWILLFVVLALSGFLGWDFWSEKKQEAQEKSQKTIVPFKMEQIQSFKIMSKKNDIEVVRSTQGWDIKKPVEDQADNEAVESFVAAAANDSIVDVVRESAVDWSLYDLIEPEGQFVFTNNQGSEFRISVSGKSNFEGHYFARLNEEDRVVTVNGNWYQRSQKSVLDFRDRRLFRGKMGGIQKVSVQNKSDSFVLENKEGTWILSGRDSVVLDQNQVRSALQSLVEVKFSEIKNHSDITNEEKKQFQLQQPHLQVNLSFAEESWSLLGGQNKEGLQFAQVSNPQFAGPLEGAGLTQFWNLKAEDLRDKGLPFAFKKEEVSILEVQTRLKKSQFKRNGNLWDLVDNSSDLIVQSEKLNLLLNNLRDSKVSKYLGKGGNESSLTNRILLKNSEGKELWQIAWQEKGAGQSFLAKSSIHDEMFEWGSSEIEKLNLTTLATEPGAKESP
ncbi:MAG: DUF4340 domain-containing protein [Bdellovibrionia bacterium]